MPADYPKFNPGTTADPARMKKADPRTKFPWPLLARMEINFDVGERQLEPGETETIVCDFFITHEPELVSVYSFIRDSGKDYFASGIEPASKPIGWKTITSAVTNAYER